MFVLLTRNINPFQTNVTGVTYLDITHSYFCAISCFFILTKLNCNQLIGLIIYFGSEFRVAKFTFSVFH